jgi:hypothetical protein
MKRNIEFTILVMNALVGVAIVVSCASQNDQARNEVSDQPTFVLMGASLGALARTGATESEFKEDSRFCLDNSANARRMADPDEKASAAYFVFHACMRFRGWSLASEDPETKYVFPHDTRD